MKNLLPILALTISTSYAQTETLQEEPTVLVTTEKVSTKATFSSSKVNPSRTKSKPTSEVEKKEEVLQEKVKRTEIEKSK